MKACISISFILLEFDCIIEKFLSSTMILYIKKECFKKNNFHIVPPLYFLFPSFLGGMRGGGREAYNAAIVYKIRFFTNDAFLFNLTIFF